MAAWRRARARAREANNWLRDARRRFERARLELDEATKAAAVAGERVRLVRALKGSMK
jgi:hypothetical protein